MCNVIIVANGITTMDRRRRRIIYINRVRRWRQQQQRLCGFQTDIVTEWEQSYSTCTRPYSHKFRIGETASHSTAVGVVKQTFAIEVQLKLEIILKLFMQAMMRMAVRFCIYPPQSTDRHSVDVPTNPATNQRTNHPVIYSAMPGWGRPFVHGRLDPTTTTTTS